MSTIHKKSTRTITFGYDVSAADLKEWLAYVPDEARVTVSHYEGDAREPSENTLTAEWNDDDSR